jgi:hypothetical protein
MCGIAAFFSSDKRISTERLKRATNSLHHRGPDSQGVWLSPNQRVGLGHARLSIIDLATGDQPIANENERGPIAEISVEGFDRTIALLLRGPFLGIKYAVPHMQDGSIYQHRQCSRFGRRGMRRIPIRQRSLVLSGRILIIALGIKPSLTFICCTTTVGRHSKRFSVSLEENVSLTCCRADIVSMKDRLCSC